MPQDCSISQLQKGKMSTWTGWCENLQNHACSTCLSKHIKLLNTFSERLLYTKTCRIVHACSGKSQGNSCTCWSKLIWEHANYSSCFLNLKLLFLVASFIAITVKFLLNTGNTITEDFPNPSVNFLHKHNMPKQVYSMMNMKGYIYIYIYIIQG